MPPARLLWVDTETGGVPKRGEKNNIALLQLSAVVTECNKALTIRSYFTSYIKPPDDLICSAGAEAVHGITRESLAREPEEKMVAEMFSAFCQANHPLRFAGFKCSFDHEMIEAMIDRHQVFVPEYVTPWFDVLDEARELLPELPNHKLVTVRQFFKMPATGAHDAAHDIYDTIRVARLLQRMRVEAA